MCWARGNAKSAVSLKIPHALCIGWVSVQGLATIIKVLRRDVNTLFIAFLIDTLNQKSIFRPLIRFGPKFVQNAIFSLPLHAKNVKNAFDFKFKISNEVYFVVKIPFFEKWFKWFKKVFFWNEMVQCVIQIWYLRMQYQVINSLSKISIKWK